MMQFLQRFLHQWPPGCQTLAKAVNRLRSNLSSLAGCIKPLGRLFTHNRNSQSTTGLLPWLSRLKIPTVFFIFGMGPFVQARVVTATVTSYAFVRHLRRTRFEFSWLLLPPPSLPLAIPTSTWGRRVWVWFVDLLAENAVTIRPNTWTGFSQVHIWDGDCLENVLSSERYGDVQLSLSRASQLAGLICIKFQMV